MKLIKRLIPVCFLLLVFTQCTNPLYEAIVNETVKEKAAKSGFYPYGACVDKASIISIVFDKSMDTSTLQMSGSMSEEAVSITWKKTTYTNDTLVLTPATTWSVDNSLGGSTASLNINVKDTEGWSCKAIVWTPEILDGVVFLSESHGIDSETGGGSAEKPFATLKYAMRAVKNVYPYSAAELRIADGDYEGETDDGPVIIESPLILKGGYKPGDWNTRDTNLFVTSIFNLITDLHIATIVCDGADDVLLDGLYLKGTRYISSYKSRYCQSLFVTGNSSVTVEDCTIENYESIAGYKSQAVCSDDDCTITIIDSTIDVVTSTDESYAIWGSGILSLVNSNVTVQNLLKTTENSINGIITNSAAVIENSSIIMKAYDETEMTGILISGDGSGSSGHISGNTVTMGIISLGEPAESAGIRGLNTQNGFEMTGNIINIPAGSPMGYGIELVACRNWELYNNVFHSGEGDYSFCVLLIASTNIIIENNTLFMGSSSNSEADTTFAGALYLMEGSQISSCTGNILYGDNRDNLESYYRTGIALSTEADTITILDFNVFCDLNNGLLGTFSTGEAYAATSGGMAELNAAYGNANNLFYSSTDDIALADWDDEYPMRPSASTPSAITRSGLSSAPLIDILGNTRTVPYSIGAYECF